MNLQLEYAKAWERLYIIKAAQLKRAKIAIYGITAIGVFISILL